MSPRPWFSPPIPTSARDLHPEHRHRQHPEARHHRRPGITHLGRRTKRQCLGHPHHPKLDVRLTRFLLQPGFGQLHQQRHRTVNISNGDVSPGNVTFSHSTGSYTINGNNGITGSGNLSITGGGTVVMNTNNSYTGTTAIQNGTLILGNSNAIPGNGTSSLVLGNNTTSGVLDTGGFDVDVSGLSTSGTGAGNIIGNSSTSSPSHINFNGGSSTFAGIIQDSINGGTQQVNLNVNSGTLVLASNNTYSGNTEVQGTRRAANRHGRQHRLVRLGQSQRRRHDRL